MNAPLPESIRKALETRLARRQVQPRFRSRLHERRAGAGAPADAATPARCACRPEHRRLHQRLPRLAPGRLRPGAVGREETPGRAAHRVPAGRERRTRRHRGVGHADARPVPAKQEVRRRVRHLVRQGPGRGPLLRRLQARQHGRHQQARRRDRHRRRRPRGQEQHRRAPERPHLQGLRTAGVLPFGRAGHPGHGAARLCDEPLLRRVERHEDDPGGGGIVGLGQRRPRPREDHPARGFRHAAGRAAHALARRCAGSGSAAVRLQVVCGAGLRARQQAQPQRHRRPERPLRHHRQRQGLQRHAPGAGRPGPGRRHLPRARHPAAQGQRGVAAGSDHHARLRAGPAGDPGGRGEAPGHRVPAEGRALQLARRRAPQRAGQVRGAARATPAAASGACPTRARTGCCAPRPT